MKKAIVAVCAKNSNPDIMVMKTTEDRVGLDVPDPLNRAKSRGIFILSFPKIISGHPQRLAVLVAGARLQWPAIRLRQRDRRLRQNDRWSLQVTPGTNRKVATVCNGKSELARKACASRRIAARDPKSDTIPIKFAQSG